MTIVFPAGRDRRIGYGLERVMQSLRAAGRPADTREESDLPADYRRLEGAKIYAGVRGESALLGRLEEQEVLAYDGPVPQGEGFYIAALPGGLTVVAGGSPSGALYGCLELARRIREGGAEEIAFGDAPVFRLRGMAVGLQKTKIEPPRQTYEYPITEERFPWFYDRGLWTRLLDRLAEQRANVLYIWSGHPFSSLVKLADYPEALEVDEEQFRRNAETFLWLTTEAGRRSIWVVMKFYNIHIPLPFARRHGLELHQTRPTPLTSDYTRKSIAEFVRSYPNVGLMVCLGEALRGTDNEVDWFVHTILPGVKDGMRAAGLTAEPPVILRAHDTDPFAVLRQAKGVYSHIYTMSKYNGESLTTWLPRGEWQQTHLRLSRLHSTHIVNVHILADLEPFRYGSPDFIRKCMRAAKYRLGASGLHLYPLFYWDWPYSPDKTPSRLLQMDRDFLWYEAWFRYAWNPDRDPELEESYWARRLGRRYGGEEAGRGALEIYRAAGECAPRLLRRFGITEGNRQTLSLGMRMTQLTDDFRYGPCVELWKSASPQGERLDEYVRRELAGEPHVGETPRDTVEQTEKFSARAVEAAEKAAPSVTRNAGEFARLCGDARAVRFMTLSYTHKVRAAALILRFRATMDERGRGDFRLLDRAAGWMRSSLDWYGKLTELTKETYLYANSMQTRQRKIPFPDGEAYGHWSACLPQYQKELENFESHLAGLKKGVLPPSARRAGGPVRPYARAAFRLLSPECETYELRNGACVFRDTLDTVSHLAGELQGLTGIRFSREKAAAGGVTIDMELDEDARILVGYFNSPDPAFLQVERLEFNAHADDRGGLAVLLKNAMRASHCPPVDIHAFSYSRGKHSLYLGKGVFMVAGAVPAGESLTPRDVGGDGLDWRTLDWMFE